MKKSIFNILLALIFLVVFNTVFFIIGGAEHPASVWISYGFIHFSYVMVLITPLFVRKSSSASVFGLSLYAVSSVYFFAEFAAGLIFVLIESETYTAALVTQIIIAGIYAAALLSNLSANEKTADSVERRENEVAYIKAAASRIKYLAGKASDKNANRQIKIIYDLLNSSQTHSDAAVKVLEQQIEDKISELENAVAADETETIIAVSHNIAEITEERNRILKLSN